MPSNTTIVTKNDLHQEIKNINQLWSLHIIDQFYKNNIRHFYLSPGMRNAPFISALKIYQRIFPEKKIFDYVVMDERQAAYRALGNSKCSLTPSVLVCTSGTAAANYYPAIIEAYKSKIPLIVISCDRPIELTKVDENQTIQQLGLFKNFVQEELYLGVASYDISPESLCAHLNHFVYKSMHPEMGPVHFNLSFRQPLENSFDSLIDETAVSTYFESSLKILKRSAPFTTYICSKQTLSDEEYNILSEKINSSKKIFLTIGPLSEYSKELEEFIQRHDLPTYFDLQSQLKYKFNLNSQSIPTLDHPEVKEFFLNNPPDLIIHIGGRMTSKHYYELMSSLRSMQKTEMIHLTETHQMHDPASSFHFKFIAHLNLLFKKLNHTFLNSSLHSSFTQPFLKDFFQKKESFTHRKIEYLQKAPLSYPKISKTILDHAPDTMPFFIGNSTAIRSFDSYFTFEFKKNHLVFANRGVSGIEGLISTSMGILDHLAQTLCVVLGDVSLIHDFNALFSLHQLKNDLKILVINNFGGGIFKLLPVKNDPETLHIITSPHSIQFDFLNHPEFKSKQQLNYLAVNNISELKEKIDYCFQTPGHFFVEIFVNDEDNEMVYKELQAIK